MDSIPIYKNKSQFFDYHGIIPFVNVKTVQLGSSYQLEPLYGNNAVFSARYFKRGGVILLGPVYEHLNKEKKIVEEHTDREVKEYKQYWEDIIYFCEYCFKYTNDEKSFNAHCKVCNYKHQQPGKIVYLGDKYILKKVSTQKHSVFLESLCLFTKFFLDNKSSFCNLQEFDFFVLYSNNPSGPLKDKNKPLGFFSKQIASTYFENLSSILVLPQYRNRGLGTLLIEFSYRLSIHELEFSSQLHGSPSPKNFTTGPESPLSPFGLVLYLNYWQKILVIEMLKYKKTNNPDTQLIKYLMEKTHFEGDHIILTLKYMKCVKLDIVLKKKYIDWERISQIYEEKNLKDYKPIINNKDLLIYY